MTTPRDLLIIAMDTVPNRPVERGDLSLALAGAEVIDLIEAEALVLEGDRIVPGLQPALADPLLEQAASSLERQAPYEAVGDWLWRRGRGLSAAYLAALESEGEVARRRHRWTPFRAGRPALADSPAHHEAVDRWTSDEPVLAALAAAVGIRGEPPGDSQAEADEAVVTVLAAVNDAVMELGAVRQRKTIEEAAFDNIWRGD